MLINKYSSLSETLNTLLSKLLKTLKFLSPPQASGALEIYLPSQTPALQTTWQNMEVISTEMKENGQLSILKSDLNTNFEFLSDGKVQKSLSEFLLEKA